MDVTEMINSLVPHKICELFGVKTMTLESLLTRLNNLTSLIQNDEAEIKRLKDSIQYEFISSDKYLLGIQNKKNQLLLSQNLLKQIQQDIKKLEFQKRNILEGNYEGQITLKNAQIKGFIFLPIDTHHAIEFLASNLRYPLINLSKVSKQKNSEADSKESSEFFDIESSQYNYKFSTSMKTEIENLFNESVKYYKGLKSTYSEQTSLNSSIIEKLSLIKNEIKSKRQERNNVIIELNRLKLEINQIARSRNVIKVRPDRFEENAKGQKIINSKKKEFYRLNRILNEFSNLNTSQKTNLKMFNSFDFEMHCFDESSHFDGDLDKLTRNARKNVLQLAKLLVEHRNDLKSKVIQKKRFLEDNIESMQKVLNKIEMSNNKVKENANNPLTESALDDS